jgi:hypothetical protein
MKSRSNRFALWERASTWDPTLAVERTMERSLCAKKLLALPYSRPAMFKSMAEGRPYFVSNLVIAAKTSGYRNTSREEALADMIERAFSHQDVARVQRGPSKKRSRMPVGELLERWRISRGIISTTDLHFRGSPAEQHIDVQPLSHFNLLPAFTPEVSFVEMLTLVIATAGNVTDSHTDDCDGSNHCFVGSKLWLIWDRIEGQSHGLQDCSHDKVYDQAAFDMGTFLSLKSSRWFVIRPGETIFLPGQFAHKVVTLERYLGFGSFYLTFPNLFRSFKRWLLDDPIDITPEMLSEIAGRVTHWLTSNDQMSRSLRKSAGADFYRYAMQKWLATEAKQIQQELVKNAVFASIFSDK